jgi:2-oxoglutarate ferredoxin oxidoreductase subunit delta
MSTKKTKKKRSINVEWCKGCGICVAFCPKGVLDLDESGKAVIARPDDCIDCGLCELRCPDLAIESEDEQAPALEAQPHQASEIV